MGKRKTYVDSVELRVKVAKQIGPFTRTIFSLYVSDEEFYLPSVADVEKVIADAKIHERDYIAEEHDCDDFARLLTSAFIRAAYSDGVRRPAFCFGLIFTTGHAFNWFMDEEKRILLVEPQTGEVMGLEALEESDQAVTFMLV